MAEELDNSADNGVTDTQVAEKPKKKAKKGSAAKSTKPKGEKKVPVPLDFVGCKEGGVPAKINSCLASKAKTAEVIAEESGVDVKRVKGHLYFWTKKGKFVKNDKGWALKEPKTKKAKTS